MLDPHQRDIKTGVLSEELINTHAKVATKTRRANWTEKQRQPASGPDETLPLTIIIDREGTIRGTIAGILLPEEFNLQIKPLLKRRAAERETNHVQKNK